MKWILSLFAQYRLAEQAIEKLDQAQYDIDNISVIARRRVFQAHLASYDRLGGDVGAIPGAALGSLTGLLVGLGATVVPNVGSVLMVGPLATAVRQVSNQLVAALQAIGVPHSVAQGYQAAIQADQMLLAIQVTDHAGQARDQLRQNGAHQFAVVEAPAGYPEAENVPDREAIA